MIKRLFSLIFLSSMAHGAITCTPLAESPYNSASSTPSVTVGVDVGTPSNGLLIVTAGIRSPTTSEITDVTWNGTSMRLGNNTKRSGRVATVWGLEAPDSGAHNVIVTYSASVTQSYTTVMICEGALQTSSVVDQSTGAASNTGTPTVNITPSEDGELIVGHLTTEFNAPPATGSGYTIIYSEDMGAFSGSAEYLVQGTAATAAVDWGSGTEEWIVAAASFKQAAAGGGSTAPPFKRRVMIAQ